MKKKEGAKGCWVRVGTGGWIHGAWLTLESFGCFCFNSFLFGFFLGGGGAYICEIFFAHRGQTCFVFLDLVRGFSLIFCGGFVFSPCNAPLLAPYKYRGVGVGDIH